MEGHRALWITIGIFLIISLACNAFAGDIEPLPPPPTTVSQIQPSATSFLAPTSTLSSSHSGDNSNVMVLVDLNVRTGPGVHYDRIGYLLEGDSAAVTGVHPQSGWWQIACPPNIKEPQCWISGGSLYTQAEGLMEVPELEAPPTPWPTSAAIQTNGALLVYTDNGRPFMRILDITQSPPALIDETILLTNDDNVQSLAISPDGQWVAYTAGDPIQNSLNVFNIKSREQRQLVDSKELPTEDEQISAGLAALISQIEWLPDSQAVAFNTAVVYQNGAGVANQEDFWTVDLVGDKSQTFPAGMAGGAFIIKSMDTIYQGHATAVTRADIAGSRVEEITQFAAINTASEYIYYPLPQLASGAYDYLAVPEREPWKLGAETTLWRIPGSGNAEIIGSIRDISILSPVAWSLDGQNLAFIQQSTDLENPLLTRLFIGEEDGSGAGPYGGGERLIFHEWGNENEKFLYSGTGFIAVGKLNSPPQQFILPLDQVINDARWLSGSAFIIAAGSLETGAWELSVADLAGDMERVATLAGINPVFDIWVP